ncbi:hypothetical protein PHYBLDRAFT_145196 [Phycomyces blakesleeanus NRRL 1555(-)]|uniref:Uncharacterized protein n=1 Tax=Phycomyces blakesleeanus (strain ATCC 8743b / DSM 1359 / FGSC 10004 / NBRC 33097 / NRRL 1555) TaxID=763407 RepID=A0A162XBI4_PHYB8|nr:hypothetical protein PHYBLDRAFT_145196 [Phycomyces blakesleeanus NRRL 1555(-)]OAD73725.1 hypothetical protein PHYBLDRAFT_145196 [Phycomyces blakesleeanus NRRL 1555(-)]|eukprot:XP_018291765.1 hypothetical protein PHYBLDRAFT_145196 [Phycomyces blakesleeanus NRRL 1555(-)]
MATIKTIKRRILKTTSIFSLQRYLPSQVMMYLARKYYVRMESGILSSNPSLETAYWAMPTLWDQLNREMADASICFTCLLINLKRASLQFIPHLVVISNAGFSSKRYRNTTFNKEENEPFYTHPCQSWAKSTKFYTPESIAIHMDKEPLDKMIALCHVALDICSIDTDKIAKLFADTQSFCDTVECQFQKILNENDSKRQLKYAKDVAHFVRQFERKCLPSTDECAVTPIESICEQQESEDLIFVKEKRRINAGRFNWNNCYSEDMTEGLFQRYSSHTTLRKAFERETL